ncbi:hypothetical protein FHG87_008427 [Trinorchestia longiramus]|nr:hypothetical protein FHG87_008427 [Trinorchestia longiramus]
MRNTILKYVSSVRETKKWKTREEPNLGTKQLRIDVPMSPAAARQVRVKQQDVNKAITDFIVEGIHPLSTVEEPAYVSLLSTLNPSISGMSRPKLIRLLTNDNALLKTNLKAKLEELDYVCLTADI